MPVGGHSSMVEPQIVVLDVAGSSPVGHPTKLSRSLIIIKHYNHGAVLG